MNITGEAAENEARAWPVTIRIPTGEHEPLVTAAQWAWMRACSAGPDAEPARTELWTELATTAAMRRLQRGPDKPGVPGQQTDLLIHAARDVAATAGHEVPFTLEYGDTYGQADTLAVPTLTESWRSIFSIFDRAESEPEPWLVDGAADTAYSPAAPSPDSWVFGPMSDGVIAALVWYNRASPTGLQLAAWIGLRGPDLAVAKRLQWALMYPLGCNPEVRVQAGLLARARDAAAEEARRQVVREFLAPLANVTIGQVGEPTDWEVPW